MINYLDAGIWGGVSFRRTDVKLGAGVLHFKAKTNDTNAGLQILVHLADKEEYVNVVSLTKISTTELQEFEIEIKQPAGGKINRITIQNSHNTGLILYLADVYYVEGATATTKPKTTTTRTTTRTTTKTTTKTTTTTTTGYPTIKPTGECTEYSKGYYPCGGLNYPDASPCCEEGFECIYVNDFYYMCALIM